jgi:hypothetical protein
MTTSRTCQSSALPDMRYKDPRKTRSDLVYMEETGTLWLWAFPELLDWHTGITWLFSPPGRNRWDGDLWGIDDDGEFVLVEAKCASQGLDPFKEFLALEGRRSNGDWSTESIGSIKEHWESLLNGERQFIDVHAKQLRDGSGFLSTWPGVVPYSWKRLAVWRWRALYLEIIAPMITGLQYETKARAALERWWRARAWSPHYEGLFTVIDSLEKPRFSGASTYKKLIECTAPERVHKRAVGCEKFSDTLRLLSWDPELE